MDEPEFSTKEIKIMRTKMLHTKKIHTFECFKANEIAHLHSGSMLVDV